MIYKKTYKHFELDIEYSFAKTGIYYITGRSGCGKSTFLALIEREMKTEYSTIFMRPFNIFSKEDSCKELLSLAHSSYHKVEEFYQKLNICDLEAKTIKQLSSGEARRLYFYVIAISSQKVVLLDEPFLNIDEEYKHIIQEIITYLGYNTLLIVANHEVLPECNCTELKIADGKLVEELSHESPVAEKTQYIQLKKVKHTALKKEVCKSIGSILCFQLLSIFIVVLVTTFINVGKFRIAQDNLNLFNNQNTICLNPQKETLNYDEVELYLNKIVANEQKISLKMQYVLADDYLCSSYISINKAISMPINIYDFCDFYTSDTQLNVGEYKISYYFLMEYLSKEFPEKNEVEVESILLQYDFASAPLILYFTMNFPQTKDSITKEFKVVGYSKEYTLVGNESIEHFILNYNPNFEIQNSQDTSIPTDKPVIYKKLALFSDKFTEESEMYLCKKYSKYSFSFSNDNTIEVENKKNVSTETYLNVLNSFDGDIAYSFTKGVYALTDTSFFDEYFSYIGNLSLGENDVLVSKNYLNYFLKIYDNYETWIDKEILIENHNFRIVGILDQVSSSDLYISESKYLQLYQDGYYKQVEVYINDYEKMDTYISCLNQGNSSVVAAKSFTANIDYDQSINDLIISKDNYINLNRIILIVAVIILAFVLVFSLYCIYLFRSKMVSYRRVKYKIKTTLLWYFIIEVLFLIACTICFSILSESVMNVIVQNTILTSLEVFPSSFSSHDFVGSYETYYIILPLFLLIISYIGGAYDRIKKH